MSHLPVERVHLLQDISEAAVLRLPVDGRQRQQVKHFVKQGRLRAGGHFRHSVLKTQKHKAFQRQTSRSIIPPLIGSVVRPPVTLIREIVDRTKRVHQADDTLFTHDLNVCLSGFLFGGGADI